MIIYYSGKLVLGYLLTAWFVFSLYVASASFTYGFFSFCVFLIAAGPYILHYKLHSSFLGMVNIQFRHTSERVRVCGCGHAENEHGCSGMGADGGPCDCAGGGIR